MAGPLKLIKLTNLTTSERSNIYAFSGGVLGCVGKAEWVVSRPAQSNCQKFEK